MAEWLNLKMSALKGSECSSLLPSPQVPKKKEDESVLDLNRQKKVDSGGGKCC